MTVTSSHTSRTGRPIEFEGDALYRVTFTRYVDAEIAAEHQRAGLPVPTLDDGNANTETLVVAAHEPGPANQFHPAENRAHVVSKLVLRGHGCRARVKMLDRTGESYIEGCIEREARQRWICTGDGALGFAERCTGIIEAGERYVEYLGETPAYQSGTRKCLACAQEFYT